MHWVKATAPDGRAVYLNLASVPTMMRADDATIAFLGGIAIGAGARVQYATTAVRETPEELMALPRLASRPEQEPAPVAELAVAARAKQKPRKAG